MTPSPVSDRFLLWLLVVPALLLFLDLGGGMAKVPVEVRSEKIVGHMVASGDWMVPRVDGRPFLSKPPLYHWMAGAAALVLGRVDWTTVRLPSALAGVFLLALTAAWGRRLGGPRLGAAAGLATGAMSLFLIMGRRAAPDMVFAALSIWALYLFDRMWHTRNRRLIPLFALACALAFVAKAHAVLIVVGAPVALALTLRRAWGRVLRPDVAGWMALAAVAGGAWYVGLYLRMPQEALFWLKLEAPQAVGLEIVGHTGRHFRPLWYYLERIWDIALPASVFIPLAAWHLWRERPWREDDGWAFVAGSFALVFVLFTLIPAKQPHYLLPLLPLLGLMVARAVLASLAATDAESARWRTGSMTALAAVLLALIGALAYYAGAVRGGGSALATGGTLAGAAVFALGLGCLVRRRAGAFLLCALAVTWCGGAVYFGSFETWKSIDRHGKRTEKQARRPGREPSRTRRGGPLVREAAS